MRPADHRRLVLERVPRDKLLRAVLLALWSYADSNTGVAWPSQPVIARLTGYSVRAVRNAVIRLEAEGWISRGRKGGTDQDARLTVYRLTAPETPAASGTQSAASTSGTQSAGSMALASPREVSDAAAGDRASGTGEGDIRQLATGHPAPRVPPNSIGTPIGTPNANSSDFVSVQTKGDRIREITKIKIAAGIDSEKKILAGLPTDLRDYEYAAFLVALVLREYRQGRRPRALDGARP